MKKLLSCFLICTLLLCSLPATALEDAVPLGDVNYDGTINAMDALLTLKYAVGKVTLTQWEVSACDVDYSDGVNAVDALHILKYSVKKITAFTPNLEGRVLCLATVFPQHLDDSHPYGKALWMGIRTAIGRNGLDGVVVDTIALNQLEERVSYYDLVEMPSENARALAKKGLLKNLYKNGAIAWEKANSGSTLSCTMGQTVCGVAGPGMGAVPLGIAMNKTMLKRYAPNSFAKLEKQFEEGTWDFNALTALCEEYRSHKSTGAILVSNTNIIGQAVMANCGYEVKFLEDGSGAVSSLATPQGITALSYVRELKTKGYYQYVSDIPTMHNAFAHGEVPMIVYHLGEVGNWSGPYVDLTAMPFPMGPNMSSYTMCAVGSNVFVMPAGDPAYGNAAAHLLTCMLQTDYLVAEYIVEQSAAYGFDSLGQQVFRYATQHTSPDLSTGPFTAAVGSVVDSSVLSSGKTPQQALPPIAGLIQQEVDAYYGQFYQ